ncbi:hypothetical protein [Selenomonas sp. KH1T6]|nr:hypothetical protein SAMN05216583_103157 [Selenomonas ruminantium]
MEILATDGSYGLENLYVKLKSSFHLIGADGQKKDSVISSLKSK